VDIESFQSLLKGGVAGRCEIGADKTQLQNVGGGKMLDHVQQEFIGKVDYRQCLVDLPAKATFRRLVVDHG
jgi:hypothetical protein